MTTGATVDPAAAKDWSVAYAAHRAAGRDCAWPNETLIRLFKSPEYIAGDFAGHLAGKAVLDVGFGNANSFELYHSLGMRISGTEVHEDILAATRQRLAGMAPAPDLRQGTNRSLPFPDASFDVLVSWNVIHYENTHADMLAAIKEYARVLKPGGRVVISTTGPEHKILEGATRIGDHRYRIGRPGEFRAGQVYYYFDTPEFIRECFATAFDGVEVGRTHDRLFRHTLDWFIITAVARKP